MTSETEQVAIKSELDYIKEHLVDVDAVLTEDDLKSIQEAEKDLKTGKTKRIYIVCG
jgi:hypothetical protein